MNEMNVYQKIIVLYRKRLYTILPETKSSYKEDGILMALEELADIEAELLLQGEKQSSIADK